MVNKDHTYTVEEVKRLGAEKYGPRYTDRYKWAFDAGVSLPTLNQFLDGARSVKKESREKIVAPFGLQVCERIVRKQRCA